MVQPLPVGNALRLFVEPPAGAVRWKVLRKGSDSFTDHDDAGAIVAYQGADHVIVDSQFLMNEVMAFYRPFYTSDGVTWSPGATAHGTPAATYTETTTDAMSMVRDRLEAGLLVEVQRGNLQSELGYIPVYVAAPSMEQDLRLPMVTVHLDSEGDSTRAIGEDITGDLQDAIGGDYEEGEGWLMDVRLAIVGWSLNGDERKELRQAIRRVVIANLALFSANGIEQVSLSQQDVDAVSGEYPAPMFQSMGTFTCLAPVRVSGSAGSIREVILRTSP